MRIVVFVFAQIGVFELEDMDAFLLLSEDPDRLQVFLDRPNDYVATFGVNFSPPKCKWLSEDDRCVQSMTSGLDYRSNQTIALGSAGCTNRRLETMGTMIQCQIQ